MGMSYLTSLNTQLFKNMHMLGLSCIFLLNFFYMYFATWPRPALTAVSKNTHIHFDSLRIYALFLLLLFKEHSLHVGTYLIGVLNVWESRWGFSMVLMLIRREGLQSKVGGKICAWVATWSLGQESYLVKIISTDDDSDDIYLLVMIAVCFTLCCDRLWRQLFFVNRYAKAYNTDTRPGNNTGKNKHILSRYKLFNQFLSLINCEELKTQFIWLLWFLILTALFTEPLITPVPLLQIWQWLLFACSAHPQIRNPIPAIFD